MQPRAPVLAIFDCNFRTLKADSLLPARFPAKLSLQQKVNYECLIQTMPA
jgi:hypothetical protein